MGEILIIALLVLAFLAIVGVVGYFLGYCIVAIFEPPKRTAPYQPRPAAPPRPPVVAPTPEPWKPPILPWKPPPARLVAIDVETTGLDARKNRVIEVGVAVFEHGELTEKRSWLVNPGKKIPPAATKIHGITNKDVDAAPKFSTVWEEIKECIGQGAVFVAYNSPFDQKFLKMEARKAGIYKDDIIDTLELESTWLDSCKLARNQLHCGNFRLDTVCKELTISTDSAHRAGADAERAGLVYLSILNRWAVKPS